MKAADKALIGFFGLFLLLCIVLLFLPVVQDGVSQRGFSGALGLPLWGLAALGIAVSLAIIISVVIANARKRR